MLSDKQSEQLMMNAARLDSALFAHVWRAGIFPASHQFQMAARADDDRLQFQADFWPRDHGKSEIFCMAYPLRRICEDPNIRILVVQKTKEEALKTLSVIKAELERNSRLKEFYREHWRATVGVNDISNASGMLLRDGKRENTWRQDRIYVKRKRLGKDPTVECVGVGGAITGGHFDIIILDDVEDDENVRTEGRRNWLLNWFSGTVMQLREPHTKIIVVGTLKTNAMDIYRAVRENPVWDCRVVSSLLSHKLSDLDYEPVMNEHGRLIDIKINTPNIVTLWPGRWNARTLLLDMFASPVRSIWIREKTNDLSAVAGKIFQRAWFKYVSSDSLPAVFETIIQAWDTAWEEGEANDWSVCTTMGLSAGKVYVLDVFRKRMITPDLLKEIRAQYRKWRPDKILIENKASGRAAVHILTSETGLPIVPVSPGGRDKVARANGVSVYLETGRVFFSAGAPWLAMFEDELVLFPEVEHDDQVDCLVYGLMELFLEEDAAEPETANLVALMEQAAQDDDAMREAVQKAMAGIQSLDGGRAARPAASDYILLEYIGPRTGHFAVDIDGITQIVASGWSRTTRRREAIDVLRLYPGQFRLQESA